MSHSIFFEEWRRCLQAHYRDVVRRNDRITQRTLKPVLERVGFTEADLQRLYIEATMHLDHVAPDFEPDLQQFDPLPVAPAMVPETTFAAHPAECSCPACMDQVDVLRHDSDGQPLDGDDIPEAIARSEWKQKSLF